MCELCRNYPCTSRCPNSEPYTSDYFCSECGENILVGEQYLVNDEGNYAHLGCISYIDDLLKFLGYEIKEMEDGI